MGAGDAGQEGPSTAAAAGGLACGSISLLLLTVVNKCAGDELYRFVFFPHYLL